MLKRFVVAFVAFIALIVPGALLLAMLASLASPAPLERPGCEQTIANAAAQVAAMQARVKSAGGAQGPARPHRRRRAWSTHRRGSQLLACRKNSPVN